MEDEAAQKQLPGKQRIFLNHGLDAVLSMFEAPIIKHVLAADMPRKTYGCAHNNSDSSCLCILVHSACRTVNGRICRPRSQGEFMMGLLQDYGYTLVETMQDADALVVNSCTVKGPSQDRTPRLGMTFSEGNFLLLCQTLPHTLPQKPLKFPAFFCFGCPVLLPLVRTCMILWNPRGPSAVDAVVPWPSKLPFVQFDLVASELLRPLAWRHLC